MTAPKGNKYAQRGDEPREAHLQIRVTRDQKGRWVAASRAKGQKLTQWVSEALDRAAARND